MSDANSRKRTSGRGARSTGPSSRRARGRTPRRDPARAVEVSSTPAAPVARRGAASSAAATATVDAPPAGDPRPAATSARTDRIRRYLLAAAGVHGVALLLIISVAVIGVTVAGGGFTPLPATIASSWMLLNLGPFGFGGTDLGLVPALPAMFFFVAVARRVRREVSGPVSIRDVRTLVAVFLGVPVALTVIAWLMLWDASGVLRIDAPFFPSALGATLAIHAAAVLAGMGPRLLRAILRRRAWPEWPLGSLRLAASYVTWLWIAGAIAVLASMAWHHGAVRETLSIADGPGAMAGLVLLSVAYLPNVAFAAAGVLSGAPANVGVAEAGLFAVTSGTLPPLPTLAAMPQSHLSMAFGVLLAVPVLIAVWRVHRHLRDGASDRPYVEVVVAALMTGVIVAVLALLMGGELGQYGWSGVNWWLAGVLASVWLVVPGALVVVMVAGFPRGDAAVEVEPEPEAPVEGEQATAEETESEAAVDEPEQEIGETDADEREDGESEGESLDDGTADAGEESPVSEVADGAGNDTDTDTDAETEVDDAEVADPEADGSDVVIGRAVRVAKPEPAGTDSNADADDATATDVVPEGDDTASDTATDVAPDGDDATGEAAGDDARS
ncbi:DUF6350 family protein [uncultured Corynebacterium sp.]|uniref:cell division protein PerM n=1 Tax=uncultured Corynebacterium sp. TaxID=159447 RepID=UPI0025FEC38D|nr:DUF6350 family protein [uncultured Corynebacterium sp.]